MPVRPVGSTYRTSSSELRHGSSPSRPLHHSTHETPMPLAAFSPLRVFPGFPSPGVPLARRAQPITAQVARLGVQPDLPFLPGGLVLSWMATGSSFQIRYCLPDLLFHQTSWNLLHIAPVPILCQTKNAVFDSSKFGLFSEGYRRVKVEDLCIKQTIANLFHGLIQSPRLLGQPLPE